MMVFGTVKSSRPNSIKFSTHTTHATCEKKGSPCQLMVLGTVKSSKPSSSSVHTPHMPPVKKRQSMSNDGL